MKKLIKKYQNPAKKLSKNQQKKLEQESRNEIYNRAYNTYTTYFGDNVKVGDILPDGTKIVKIDASSDSPGYGNIYYEDDPINGNYSNYGKISTLDREPINWMQIYDDMATNDPTDRKLTDSEVNILSKIIAGNVKNTVEEIDDTKELFNNSTLNKDVPILSTINAGYNLYKNPTVINTMNYLKNVYLDKYPLLQALGSLLKQPLRNRMYETVTPYGYTRENLNNFIDGKERYTYMDLNTEALFGKYTGQDSIIGFADPINKVYSNVELGRPYPNVNDNKIFNYGGNYYFYVSPEGDYVDLRKVAVSDLIKPSKYKNGAFEFVYPLGSRIPTIIPGQRELHNSSLGQYLATPGVNSQDGIYVDYKDTWNINPWSGYSTKDDSLFQNSFAKKLGLDKIDDVVPWGIPFNIYGRATNLNSKFVPLLDRKKGVIYKYNY